MDKVLLGELGSELDFQKLFEVGSKGHKFDPYKKCTCSECHGNFKYRLDSLEGRFGTCPYCGFANAYSDSTSSLRDLISRMYKSYTGEDIDLEPESSNMGLNSPLYETESASLHWLDLRSELSKHAYLPFTVKCDSNWNLLKE